MPTRAGRYKLIYKPPPLDAHAWRDQMNPFGWFVYGPERTLADVRQALPRANRSGWKAQIIRVA